MYLRKIFHTLPTASFFGLSTAWDNASDLAEEDGDSSDS